MVASCQPPRHQTPPAGGGYAGRGGGGARRRRRTRRTPAVDRAAVNAVGPRHMRSIASTAAEASRGRVRARCGSRARRRTSRVCCWMTSACSPEATPIGTLDRRRPQGGGAAFELARGGDAVVETRDGAGSVETSSSRKSGGSALRNSESSSRNLLRVLLRRRPRRRAPEVGSPVSSGEGSRARASPRRDSPAAGRSAAEFPPPVRIPAIHGRRTTVAGGSGAGAISASSSRERGSGV